MNCKLFSWPLVEQWRIATSSQRTRRRPLPLGKVQRLCDDITCLCIGVKPALLLDYVVNIDLQSLEELVKLWKDGDRLKVFTLNGDYFILNEIAFDKDHYASLFIDISQTNAQPYISESLEIGSLIKKQIKEFIDITKLKESSILHDQSTTLPHSLNYCAMYGWLLGYPLIYYWNIHNENSNTLDVVQCKVTIASDLLLEKDGHSLFAFSFPVVLEEQAKLIISKWFQRLQTNNNTLELQLSLNKISNAQLVL